MSTSHYSFLFKPPVAKCINKNCSYYKDNLKLLPKDLNPKDKYKYKLHYIYREFTLDFFSMDSNQLPPWATSFKFRKNNAHIMGLYLTYHVNFGLSLPKTAEEMQEIHNISIFHTIVSSYARTATILIKSFVDSYDYNPSNNLSADETYIKIKGIKAYVWMIMDTISWIYVNTLDKNLGFY